MTGTAVNWGDPATWSPDSFSFLCRESDLSWEAAEPGPRLLVAAHDAGGAEVLAAWVARRLARSAEGKAPPLSPRFLLEGPARAVFQRAGLAGAEEQVDRAAAFAPGQSWDWILTGTGWASDLERFALREGSARRTPTHSYLDHWVNYRRRFQEGEGQPLRLPDRIWIGDPWAAPLAGEAFGDAAKIVHMPNPYFSALRGAYERDAGKEAGGREGEGPRYLYIAEPVSQAAAVQFGDPNWYGYTEFTALSGFLSRMGSGDSAVPPGQVRLRPHPSEKPEKYADLMSRQGVDWHPSPSGGSLMDDCLWAGAVVGCNSMAFIAGWLAGRRLFCSIPSGGPACAIPLPAIERLFPS